jgi:hypothetical protein
MSHNEVPHGMFRTPESVSSEIRRLAAELRHLEQRLGCEPAPEMTALSELRQAVDNIRFKAWAVSELINARYTKKDPDGVLAFLAAERLRRLDQLVKTLCEDIQRGAVTFETSGMHSLLDSLDTLQRLAQTPKLPRQSFKVKDAAS